MNAQAEIDNIRRLGISSNNSFKARLAWAIGARSIFTLLWDGTVVYPNDPRILLIANSDGEKGWIETQDNDRQLSPIPLDTNVHYQFSVEMKGRLEGLGYDLLRCTVICDLVYNSIKNELELKILERPTHILGAGGSISQLQEFQ